MVQPRRDECRTVATEEREDRGQGNLSMRVGGNSLAVEEVGNGGPARVVLRMVVPWELTGPDRYILDNREGQAARGQASLCS